MKTAKTESERPRGKVHAAYLRDRNKVVAWKQVKERAR